MYYALHNLLWPVSYFTLSFLELQNISQIFSVTLYYLILKGLPLQNISLKQNIQQTL